MKNNKHEMEDKWFIDLIRIMGPWMEQAEREAQNKVFFIKSETRERVEAMHSCIQDDEGLHFHYQIDKISGGLDIKLSGFVIGSRQVDLAEMLSLADLFSIDSDDNEGVVIWMKIRNACVVIEKGEK